MIGHIDIGYGGLTAAQNAGVAPPSGQVVRINYTGNGFESGIDHGNKTLQTIYDHCPQATFRLYLVNDTSDLLTAVQDCIDNGVHLISQSLSYFNEGWHDDTGAACEAANTAVENGILFFCGAGNFAEQHYQGDITDNDGDGWHNFDPNDETIDIDVDPGATVTFYLSCPQVVQPIHNYLDLYVYVNGSMAVSSTSFGNIFEQLSYTNNGNSIQRMDLAVFSFPSTVPEFEIFMTESGGQGAWLESIVREGSNTSPSNSTKRNVVCVGGVPWSDHASPVGDTPIANYSGQGPSNNGMMLPDLVAPTSTTCLINGVNVGVGGNSIATPNAAGTAAVLWSCDPSMNAAKVRRALYDWAPIKDWGDAGDDDVYGRGGINLPLYDDCDDNGTVDACEIVTEDVEDVDNDGVPPACEKFGFGGTFVMKLIPYQYVDSTLGFNPEIIDFYVATHINPGPDDSSGGGRIDGLVMEIVDLPEILFPVAAEPSEDPKAILGEGASDHVQFQRNGGNLRITVDFPQNAILTTNENIGLLNIGYAVDRVRLAESQGRATIPLTWARSAGTTARNFILTDGQPYPVALQDGSVALSSFASNVFRRGDCNDDGNTDMTDSINTLESLSLGTFTIPCDDACDSNDDGLVDTTDVINSLSVIFLGQGFIPAPGSEACGVDPTDDEIGCASFASCP